MNPTPNQITECDDEKLLCEWAAVYCMGYNSSEAFADVYMVKEMGSTHYLPKARYQPTSPTEKGKAQCWDLEEKFQLSIHSVDWYKSDVMWSARHGNNNSVFAKSRQVAVVKAALLCVMRD